MVASVAAAGAIAVMYGQEPFLQVYDHWTGLVTASLIMSAAQVNSAWRCDAIKRLIERDAQAVGCYAASFVPGTMLAVGGNSGNVLYDVHLSGSHLRSAQTADLRGSSGSLAVR